MISESKHVETHTHQALAAPVFDESDGLQQRRHVWRLPQRAIASRSQHGHTGVARAPGWHGGSALHHQRGAPAVDRLHIAREQRHTMHAGGRPAGVWVQHVVQAAPAAHEAALMAQAEAMRKRADAMDEEALQAEISLRFLHQELREIQEQDDFDAIEFLLPMVL